MRHTRKIARLPHFDYRSDGGYAVTICAIDRKCVFGTIREGEMHLSPYGRIALEQWYETPIKRPYVILDEFTIMPNHIHGILFFEENCVHETNELASREFNAPQRGSLGTVIGAYKSSVSREIGKIRGVKTPTWQDGFGDHIIRHERDLENQRLYIRNNPSKWDEDEINPKNPIPVWFDTKYYPFPE